MMTVSAAVSVMPWPPARVLSRNTKPLEPAAQTRQNQTHEKTLRRQSAPVQMCCIGNGLTVFLRCLSTKNHISPIACRAKSQVSTWTLVLWTPDVF